MERSEQRRPLQPRTSELQRRPRGRELTGRAWEAIERAEQHMETSAKRLGRSQALLSSGAQRVQWITERVDGYGAVSSTVGRTTVDGQ